MRLPLPVKLMPYGSWYATDLQDWVAPSVWRKFLPAVMWPLQHQDIELLRPMQDEVKG